ncbi:hypothetical protein ACP70R_037665 [Stipagrostis hirtigluma subsp. patula]
MDAVTSQGDKKLHFRDSSSQVPLRTYKRRRRQQQPQPEQQPQQQQPQPEPKSQPQPQSQPQQPQLETEHKVADAPAEGGTDTFWKSRDIGWKHGIMIDENRQHWKCRYCHLTRYGGGVSRLKRHLAGDLDVKMCPKVPADVSEKIREHLRRKRQRRKKRAAQNDGNNVKAKGSSDDAMVEKDPLPASSVVQDGRGTYVVEEDTNQTSKAYQDSTPPEVPISRGVRDIGWKYAVDLDGNKRRWQCKWCFRCRSGGVTTLKAHLTDDSCPNVPKEVSKKVSNFIEEKRATRLQFSSNIWSPFDFILNKDQVFDTQSKGEETLQCEIDQLPSRNGTHMQMSSNCSIDEVAAGSNQCSVESSDQPVKHCHRTEEQRAVDHSTTHQVVNNKQQMVDKNTENAQNTKLVAGSNECGVESSGQSVEQCDQQEEEWAHQLINHKQQIMDKSTENVQNTKEVAAGSNQCGVESSDQPVKHCHRTEEQRAVDHSMTHQVVNNKHQIVDKNTENAQNTKLADGCNECGAESGGQSVEQCDQQEEQWADQLINNKQQIMDKNTENVQSTKELEAGRNQCGAESGGEPVWQCGQHGEQRAMDHDRAQVINNKQQTLDNKENKQNTKKILKLHRKTRFNTRKHIIIIDEVARHWKCRYCGMDGYGKMYRLHYHLAGALCHPKCPSVPREVYAKARRHILAKRKLTKNKAGQQIPSGSHILEKSSEELHNGSPLCCNHPHFSINNGCTEPIKVVPHENGLCGNTNESENRGSDCWRHWWRYVLDRLMHLPDVQEGAGIWTSIRDALLYGCAEFGTVGDKVEMDSNGTVNVNTAKCQNVLMDVLRSENFALLCNVLCKTVHQDEERTRYFDFGVIDSRMKNGNYGDEPGLFICDLKLLWEDLKMAGQHIIDLANSLSSLTEDSYRKQVGREEGLDDAELKGAIMTSSEPMNLVEPNLLVPSTSQGFNQLDQPDPIDVSDAQRYSTCNQCGKEARGESVLRCNRCKLFFHISCIEPPVPSVSTGSWYCKNCSTTCEEPAEGDMALAHYQPNCLHGDCVVCDGLEISGLPKCGQKVSKSTPNDNSRAIVIYSEEPIEEREQSKIDTVGSCKICGHPEEIDKRFLICSHVHCLYKYYHIQCLNSNQIASDVQRRRPCWYCPSCLCRVCLSDKDDDLTILCDGCDEAYHLYCVTPRRTSIPKGQWYCSSCSVERAKEGMKQYEKRMLKLHRNDDAKLQSRNYEGLDLLVFAAEQLSADEQLASCAN